MFLPYLSQDEAKEFDLWLMSPQGAAFTLPQLMELAGLTISTIISDFYPLPKTQRVFFATGPGNNGGDGLVAARHLATFAYDVTVYRPNNEKESDFFKSLMIQAEFSGVKIISELPSSINKDDYDILVETIFGFGFKGELRAPFDICLQKMISSGIPILAVDCPTGWTATACTNFEPEILISLTTPKECAKHFKGKYHVLGGRFIPKKLPEQFNKLSIISELYRSSSLYIKL